MTAQRRGALNEIARASEEGAANAPQSLYDRDFALWVAEQAQALKERRTAELDWDNLVEEVDALGRSDRRAIRSCLENALLHMLKLAYWVSERERNENLWREHLINARDGIVKVIEDSPSLRIYPAEILSKSYSAALRRAQTLIGRQDLPDGCPWLLERVLDEGFWPEPAADS
jgi:hypothetical protein